MGVFFAKRLPLNATAPFNLFRAFVEKIISTIKQILDRYYMVSLKGDILSVFDKYST